MAAEHVIESHLHPALIIQRSATDNMFLWSFN